MVGKAFAALYNAVPQNNKNLHCIMQPYGEQSLRCIMNLFGGTKALVSLFNSGFELDGIHRFELHHSTLCYNRVRKKALFIAL